MSTFTTFLSEWPRSHETSDSASLRRLLHREHARALLGKTFTDKRELENHYVSKARTCVAVFLAPRNIKLPKLQFH